MVKLVPALAIEKSFVAVFLVLFILLLRNYLNRSSLRYAVMILWGLLFVYLITPFQAVITVDPLNRSTVLAFLLKVHTFFNETLLVVLNFSSYYIPFIRRVPIALVLMIYIFAQGYRRLIVMSKAEKLVHENTQQLIQQFHLKRKVVVLVNDHLKAPVTLGVFRQKIILQSKILQDQHLLQFVLLHELSHIKGFHVLWNHLKYLIACCYWYNPLIWVVSNYVERDVEILCDKSVLKRIGDTKENALAYSLAMVNFLKGKRKEKEILTLKLHPTLERIKIMKKRKTTLIGILVLLLSITLISTSFASYEEAKGPQTRRTRLIKEKINIDGRTTVLTEEEAQQMMLEDDAIGLYVANIDEYRTLQGLETCRYDFRMLSLTGPPHQKIITRITDTSTAGEMSFTVMIYQDGRIVYEGMFDGDVTLTTTECNIKSKYTVALLNHSLSALSFRIRINTYIN